MKINRLSFPTPLSKIKDIEDDNIDVFIELEDGNSYSVVVATVKNMLRLMEKEGLDYYPAAPPFIIVRRLTLETITAVLETYCENDAYWLKENFLSGCFEIQLLDKMIEKLKNR